MAQRFQSITMLRIYNIVLFTRTVDSHYDGESTVFSYRIKWIYEEDQKESLCTIQKIRD